MKNACGQKWMLSAEKGRGGASVRSEFESVGVSMRTQMVGSLDAVALHDALLTAAERDDGIAFVGIDHPLVREAVKVVRERGVGVVSLMTDVVSPNRTGYVGIDNRAAGRTAGLLMGRFLGGHSGVSAVGLMVGSHSYRGHEEREAGFRSILAERFPHLTIVTLAECRDDDDISERLVIEALAARPEIAGIYNVGGGSFGIGSALTRAAASHIVFIGHELTAYTRRFLVSGVTDAIINQDTGAEIRAAVRMLANHASGLPPLQGVTMPRVEIIVAENLW
jgi:LacI family transcriptional regulator